MRSAVLYEEKARPRVNLSKYETAIEKYMRQRNDMKNKVVKDRREIDELLIKKNDVRKQSLI